MPILNPKDIYDTELPDKLAELREEFDYSSKRGEFDYSNSGGVKTGSRGKIVDDLKNMRKIGYKELQHYGFVIKSIRNASPFSPYESVYSFIRISEKPRLGKVINELPSTLSIYIKKLDLERSMLVLVRERVNKKQVEDTVVFTPKIK